MLERQGPARHLHRRCSLGDRPHPARLSTQALNAFESDLSLRLCGGAELRRHWRRLSTRKRPRPAGRRVPRRLDPLSSRHGEPATFGLETASQLVLLRPVVSPSGHNARPFQAPISQEGDRRIRFGLVYAQSPSGTSASAQHRRPSQRSVRSERSPSAPLWPRVRHADHTVQPHGRPDTAPGNEKRPAFRAFSA